MIQFVCTPPAPQPAASTHWRDTYPLWWEREVQKRIRDLRPPIAPPFHMLIGEDEDGIAAVAYYEELDAASVVHLTYMAVASRWRYQGSGIAHELVSQTLDTLLSRAVQDAVPHVRLTAYVWEGNHASRKLCVWAGLRHNGYTEAGMELWSGDLYPDEEHDPWLWTDPPDARS